MTASLDDSYYHRAVASEQEYALESLRMERDEQAQRIAELSSAIELLREKQADLADAAASLNTELDHYKRENARLRAQIAQVKAMFGSDG